jgi:hypothetical protein
MSLFSLRSINSLAHSCGLGLTEIPGIARFHSLKSRLPSLLASGVTFRVQHINLTSLSERFRLEVW